VCGKLSQHQCAACRDPLHAAWLSLPIHSAGNA
jgi:hypothetical protein